MNATQRLLSPVVQGPFFFAVTLLLSVPGIVYCCVAFPEIPLVRTILWSCYITAFPAALAWLLAWKGNRVVKTLTYVVALTLFLVNMFLVLNFSTLVSPSILLLCLETHASEASEFMASYLFCAKSILAYALTAGAVVTIVLLERRGKNIPLPRSKLGVLLLTAWFLVACVHTISMGYMLFCQTQEKLSIWYNGLGLYDTDDTLSNLIYSVHHLRLAGEENGWAIETNRKAVAEEALCADSADLDVVVVIGESYNKHHSQLYGYHRDTTPCMARERDEGHLFVFTDVISPFNLTTAAMKNLLSTNSLSLAENWADRPVFPVIFRQAGFSVAMWDNQKIMGNAPFHDFAIGSFLYNDEVVAMAYDQCNSSVFPYDMQLVDSCLQARSEGHHRLTIFHLIGQHSQASKRYPHTADYEVFRAADAADAQQQAIAEYDNATFYNDVVMESIFNYYRERNAVVIYFSDHGEEVYDYRPFAGRSHEQQKHAQALKYQYEIPFVVWCSEQYIESHPQQSAALAASLHRPFMTDNLPHLLFSLASVVTPYYRAEKDLLSPSYVCGKRLVQVSNDYDAIMKTP